MKIIEVDKSIGVIKTWPAVNITRATDKQTAKTTVDTAMRGCQFIGLRTDISGVPAVHPVPGLWQPQYQHLAKVYHAHNYRHYRQHLEHAVLSWLSR